jgi:two-component system chemotaxis sensor kinase CheA
MVEDDEIFKEFIVETQDGLDQVDRELLEIEKDPNPGSRIAVIFRAIHTLKGTVGFLGFSRLERLAHVGENLLSAMRDGSLKPSNEIVASLFAMVDAIRQQVATIVVERREVEVDNEPLIKRLAAHLETESVAASRAAKSLAGKPVIPVIPVARRAESRAAEPAATPQSASPSAPATAPAAKSKELATLPPAQVVPAPEPPPRARAATPTPVAVEHAPEVHAPTPDAADAVNAARSVDTTVRVDVGLLDRLMNLVGELVLARNQILQHDVTLSDSVLASSAQRLDLITTELQQGVMKARMQPIGGVWGKFPRMVRDLAVACGKQVELEMEGRETELDRTILEAIRDPLTHLLRNAIDHGLEPPEVRADRGKSLTGRLLLRSYHEGGQVVIELIDDGQGIDHEKVRKRAIERGVVTAQRAQRMSERELIGLIFLPGFSTAEKVTNLSGRGVGMDVVRTNVERIGGAIDIDSRLGHGTTIRLKIPLTLAIIPALVVTASKDAYAIPQVSLLELVRLDGEAIRTKIEWIHGAPVHRLRGQLLPLVWLSEALGLGGALKEGQSVDGSDALNIVIVQAESRTFGLVVDEVHDTEEIVVKPLGTELKGIPVYAGATIMGDGRVALILDVLGIAQRSALIAEVRERNLLASANEAAASGAKREALLVVNVGEDSRFALPLTYVARLEEIPTDRIEHMGSRQVVQHRGRIMPLLDLRERFGGSGTRTGGPLPVVVHVHGENAIGFVVDAIVDIVEDVVELGHHGGRPGIAGALVVHGRVTELLDVRSIVASVDESFYKQGTVAA